jgi:hypothetical protein
MRGRELWQSRQIVIVPITALLVALELPLYGQMLLVFGQRRGRGGRFRLLRG